MTVSDQEYNRRNTAVDAALDSLKTRLNGNGNGNGSGFKFDWKTVITWITAVILAYGAVEARVRVLEDRYERMRSDLSEIKSDVKELLRVRP